MKYSSEHFEITKRFWDGTKKDKDTGEVTQFKFNQDGMEAAIERATRDLMARTLTPNVVAEGKFSEAVVKPLREELEKWFISRDQVTEADFDAWHAEACTVVLDILRKYYYNDKDQNLVQYGKAQKIVNMTMKGLYCLPGSEQCENHFRFCHIALDSFTLEWFKRKVILTYEECHKTWIKTLQKAAYETNQGSTWLQNRGKKQNATFMRECFSNKALKTEQNELVKQLREHLESPKTLVKKRPDTIPEPYFTQIIEEELRKMEAGGYFPAELTVGRILSWSALPQPGSSYYGYDEYVRWIRIYFATNHTYADEKTKKSLTPFQAEFYIWPEIQLELAAEAFYGQDIGKVEAVEEAERNEEWKEKWNKDKVGEKDFDVQFKWCKERFKEEPLDKKMEYLYRRVEKLNKLFGNAESALQEVLQ